MNELRAGGGITTSEDSQALMNVACVSLLFKFRYGFYPDSQVPFGRLQPYLMVGPGILLSWLRGHIDDDNPVKGTAAAVALVAEAGVRYMALKNVSLDVGFRYRFAKPQFGNSTPGEESVTTIKMDYNLFAVMFRASYHF